MKSSVLDLYFTNKPGKISDIHLSGIMDSDHKMIVASRRTADKIPLPSVVRKRKWSKMDWSKFNKAYTESGAAQWILDIEDTHKAARLCGAAVRVHLDMQQQVKQNTKLEKEKLHLTLNLEQSTKKCDEI